MGCARREFVASVLEAVSLRAASKSLRSPDIFPHQMNHRQRNYTWMGVIKSSTAPSISCATVTDTPMAADSLPICPARCSCAYRSVTMAKYVCAVTSTSQIPASTNVVYLLVVQRV